MDRLPFLLACPWAVQEQLVPLRLGAGGEDRCQGSGQFFLALQCKVFLVAENKVLKLAQPFLFLK